MKFFLCGKCGTYGPIELLIPPIKYPFFVAEPNDEGTEIGVKRKENFFLNDCVK